MGTTIHFPRTQTSPRTLVILLRPDFSHLTRADVVSALPIIKAEEIDAELLQLRCADLEADRERLEEELAVLHTQLAEARSEVTEWKLLAKTISGSIREAAQHFAEAGILEI
jgi:chromosome segregation ATPase